jgi:hypothetical protein
LAVAVRYTSFYVLVTAALCWLIQRRSHRGHLILPGCGLVMLTG